MDMGPPRNRCATHNFQTSGARKTTTTPNQTNLKERRSGSLPRAQQLDATLRLSILFQSLPQVGSNTIRKRQIEAIGPQSYPFCGAHVAAGQIVHAYVDDRYV